MMFSFEKMEERNGEKQNGDENILWYLVAWNTKANNNGWWAMLMTASAPPRSWCPRESSFHIFFLISFSIHSFPKIFPFIFLSCLAAAAAAAVHCSARNKTESKCPNFFGTKQVTLGLLCFLFPFCLFGRLVEIGWKWKIEIWNEHNLLAIPMRIYVRFLCCFMSNVQALFPRQTRLVGLVYIQMNDTSLVIPATTTTTPAG